MIQKRRSPKKTSTKRRSPKKTSTKRRSPKKTSTKRRSPKKTSRHSTKRKSTKLQLTKRKSMKRKSTKRKSIQKKRSPTKRSTTKRSTKRSIKSKNKQTGGVIISNDNGKEYDTWTLKRKILYRNVKDICEGKTDTFENDDKSTYNVKISDGLRGIYDLKDNKCIIKKNGSNINKAECERMNRYTVFLNSQKKGNKHIKLGDGKWIPELDSCEFKFKITSPELNIEKKKEEEINITKTNEPDSLKLESTNQP
jgi:hypothetical protein